MGGFSGRSPVVNCNLLQKLQCWLEIGVSTFHGQNSANTKFLRGRWQERAARAARGASGPVGARPEPASLCDNFARLPSAPGCKWGLLEPQLTQSRAVLPGLSVTTNRKNSQITSSWEKLSRGQFFEGRVLGATCERAYADATTRQVPTGGALGSY